jgi:hypothetical protein
MFARSAAERAFARAMGDDMDTSNAGFATPEFTMKPAAKDDSEVEVLRSAF